MTGPAATLSRDLADFLVEFSIVLHKRSIYPAGHPYLQASADRFADRLDTLLELREALTLGVARDKLVIESATTDPGNALLRELSHRLHRHQLASIGFLRGVALEEVEGLLVAISADPERGGPFGRRLEAAGGWPHIQLRATGYARLTLREDAGDAGDQQVRDFWLELAQAALADGGSDGDADDADSDPLIVTDAVDRDSGAAAYDSVVLGYLSRIAEEQSGRAGVGEERLRRRVSRLVAELDPDTLRRLLEAGADHSQRQQHLVGASQTLAVDAVVTVLEGAAKTSHHTISHYLLRLLHTLARQAKSGPEPAPTEADGALRRNVAQLISDWKLDDPNPGTYNAILEGMVRELPTPGPADAQARCDPELVVQMAAEVGSCGPSVLAAAEALSIQRRLARLSEIIESAPATDAGRRIWAHVATEPRLQAELEALAPDHDVVALLSRHLGAAAAEPLLDALESAASRSGRAAILKHLLALGPEAASAAANRLAAAPWYLQRNILVLIGQWRSWPEGFTPVPYATDGDVRVRREAIKLLLASPEYRADAVMTGLRDADDGIVALALGAVADSEQPEALPLVAGIAAAAGRDSSIRVQAVRVLARVRTPATAHTLVSLAMARRRWLGRPLAPKSPELLAAIEALATHWREEPQVATVLRHASRHHDVEIRNAARGATA